MPVAPHEIEQLRARVDAPRMPRELQEEIELLRRQLDDVLAEGDLALLDIDAQIAVRSSELDRIRALAATS